MIKKLLIYIGLLVGLLFLFALKNFMLQTHYIQKAKDAIQKREYIKAIDYYERVVLAYLPLVGYSDEAIGAIRDMCPKLSIPDEKLYCYETLRVDARQVESFYKPYQKEVELATREIIEIKSREFGKNSKTLKAIKTQETHTWNTHTLWGFMVPLSLLTWVGSTLAWIWRREKKFILVSVAGYALWLVSLYLA